MASLSVAELGILNWIQTNCHNEFWDEVMPVLTSLGNGGLIWIALAVAILLLQRGKRGTGLQVLIALLLSLLLCEDTSVHISLDVDINKCRSSAK